MIWLTIANVVLCGVQDGPGSTRTGDVRYEFNVRQGWTQTTYSERDLRSRERLTESVQRAIIRSMGTYASDPIELEGTLVLGGDGAWMLMLDRVEYWDNRQRWWIEFRGDQVRTSHLGGASGWSGSREEWRDRLAEIEEAYGRTYLAASTRQVPGEGRTTLGRPIASAPTPGRRLFALGCLEEQGAALLLARLNGSRQSGSLRAPGYPAPAVAQAQALVNRMILQASGTLAPPAARRRSSRSARAIAWKQGDDFVPPLGWLDGSGRAAPIATAREALGQPANASRSGGGIDEGVGNAAGDRRLAGLRRQFGSAPGAPPPQVPRVAAFGRGVYDYKERLRSKGEKVSSSRVEIQATFRDMEVAFYDAHLDRWRVSRLKLDTSYRGSFRLREGE